MNNKFKDLMIVAQQQAAKETIQNSFAYEQLVFQKFGEMIVQECAQVGEDTDGNWNVKSEILKTFNLK